MDNKSLLQRAREEELDLLAVLENSLEYKRLKKVRAVIRTLSTSDDPETVRASLPESKPATEARPRGTTKTEIISAAAEGYLRRNPGWHPPAEIYDALIEQGVEIGGQNPKGNMTAHMSLSGRFMSDRTRGWRLSNEEPSSPSESSSVAGTRAFYGEGNEL